MVLPLNNSKAYKKNRWWHAASDWLSRSNLEDVFKWDRLIKKAVSKSTFKSKWIRSDDTIPVTWQHWHHDITSSCQGNSLFVFSSYFYSVSLSHFPYLFLSLSLSRTHTHTHTHVDLTNHFVITLKHFLISADIVLLTQLASMTPLVMKVQVQC